MNDKKVISIAIGLSLLLIAGGWYYARIRPQSAAIAPISSTSQTPQPIASTPGIIIGNPTAPVTMEEYTNFLCSACASFATNTLPKIMDDYVKTGKVKIVVYVNPPIEMTKAALCAQEQNKFTEFHDYTFAHQKDITQEADIKIFANNAGLDSTKFDACYASDKYNDLAGSGSQPGKWYQEGVARGVDATPTFFINGQKFVGTYPYSEFQKIIDEKLKAK